MHSSHPKVFYEVFDSGRREIFPIDIISAYQDGAKDGPQSAAAAGLTCELGVVN